jgi:hypothetical protein
MLDPSMQWLYYALFSVPVFLLFVIVDLWLCLQIKAVWRILTGRRNGSNGYTSTRTSRSERSKSSKSNSKLGKENLVSH